MQPINTFEVNCPYCGEMIELLIDQSVGSQEYTEDCSVCCRPMLVAVRRDRQGGFFVDVRSEGE